MFVTNNLPQCALSTGYNRKYIGKSANTKFLWLFLSKEVCINLGGERGGGIHQTVKEYSLYKKK
jgi:hypothetical protein